MSADVCKEFGKNWEEAIDASAPSNPPSSTSDLPDDAGVKMGRYGSHLSRDKGIFCCFWRKLDSGSTAHLHISDSLRKTSVWMTEVLVSAGSLGGDSWCGNVIKVCHRWSFITSFLEKPSENQKWLLQDSWTWLPQDPTSDGPPSPGNRQ